MTQGSDSKAVATASPDGRVLLLHAIGRDGKGLHLWAKPLESPESELQPLVMDAAINAEGYGRFSPDGRQVAYMSDDEVWVKEYPTGRAQQISSDGGSWPVWNPRDDEVFYQSKRGMMSVTFVDEARNAGPRRPTRAEAVTTLCRRRGSVPAFDEETAVTADASELTLIWCHDGNRTNRVVRPYLNKPLCGTIR